MMKRALWAAVALMTTTLIACEENAVGPNGGGIAFRIHVIGTASPASQAPAAASGPSMSSHQTPLDSGRVILTGPTNRTVSATPGQPVTIMGLALGTYAAELQGFSGDQITFQGFVTGISVTAGGDTQVTDALLIPSSIEFGAIDETIQLTGAPAGTVWNSSNTNIVTVNAAGLVTAVANGLADVTASFGSSAGQSSANVHQNVSSVSVSPASPTIAVGGTSQFTATALDTNSNPVMGVSTLWVSTNPEVATVNQSGLATGRSAGSTTITAAIDGEVGNATLTVGAGAATRLAFMTQPGDEEPDNTLASVQVAIKDAAGVTVAGATNDVTIDFGSNPDGAGLSGTLTVAAVAGVATFGDLTIDARSAGATLSATATGLTSAETDPFNVWLDFVDVDAADFHGCGATTQGNAYCWGFNGEGALGTGDNTQMTVPTLVVDGHDFVAIATGGRSTCGLTSDDDLFCWGRGFNGQLGNGQLVNQNTPQLVSGGRSWQSVSVGQFHTCGIDSNDDAFCWGTAGNGRLGNGTTAPDQSAPVTVVGGNKFRSISAGSAHTCGIRTDGLALCWGAASVGRLGNNTTTPDLLAPAPVFGNPTYVSLNAGGSHTCGVDTFGNTRCWGESANGRLGDNQSVTDRLTPFNVQGGIPFDEVSAGGAHSCGLTRGSRSPFCWGAGSTSRLGNGSDLTDQLTPVPVLGGLNFSKIVAGLNAVSCGLTQDGGIHCWGHGTNGQRGDGTTTNASVPVRVVGSK